MLLNASTLSEQEVGTPANEPDNTIEELDTLVELLFEQHNQRICAYIHSLVHDWQLARDLTQETYLRLFRTRDRLPAVENQRAWVYRIATHISINEVKRRGRFTWLPWSKIDTSPALTWARNTTSNTEQAHEREAIEGALATLPQHYRAPLLLYSSYGFRVKEVADALELTESAVKVRLHRARKMFRDAYKFGEEA